MSQGTRFALALVLMIGVFVLTSVLFPTAPPEPAPAAEPDPPVEADVRFDEPVEPPVELPAVSQDLPAPTAGEQPWSDDPERIVTVETPLYRIEFSNYGGVVRSVRLAGYRSFTRDGPVELVPDGSQILFAANHDGDLEIYVVGADGSDERQLTDNNGQDFFPSWSPDGQTIVFSSDRSGAVELYLMDADGDNQRPLMATDG